MSSVRWNEAPVRSILLTKQNPRHAVLVSLAPDGFRLRLDTSNGVENDNATIEHAQGTLDLNRKVDVTGVSIILMR